MRCDETRDRLSEYLDGELPPGERRGVEQHLAACEGCRKELSELEATLGHLDSLSEVEPPPFYTQGVMRRVREEARPGPGLLGRLFFPLRVKLPAEALALALVAVVAIYVFKAMGPEVTMKPEEVAMKPPTVASAPEAGDEMAPLGEMTKEKIPPEEDVGLGNEKEKAITGEGQALEKKAAEPEYGVSGKSEPTPPKRMMRDAAAPSAEAEALRERPAREEFRLAPKAPGDEKSGLAAGREDYEVSVSVPRPGEAEEAVEAAVEAAGGKVMEKEPAAGERAFYAEIAPERIADLLQELGGLGDVGDVRAVSESPAGDAVVVRIRLQQGK
ncbi:MAG: zf-HC2 domain-containing protein [Nitrospirota bacterium]|jgi:hypothetical protein